MSDKQYCANLVLDIICFLSVSIAGEKLGDYNIIKGLWDGDSIEYLDGILVVGLNQGYSESAARELLNGFNTELIDDFDRLGIARIMLPKNVDMCKLSEPSELKMEQTKRHFC